MDEPGPIHAGAEVPEIEPVRSVTVPAIKPGSGWYWAGGLTVALGLLIAFLMLVVGSSGYIRDVRSVDGPPVVSPQEEAEAQERLSNWGRGALLVAAGGVVGGTAVIVVTVRGRRRSQAARLSQETP